MKRIIIYSTIVALIFLNGCKKETDSAKLPTIATTSISSITATTAISGGTISNNGGDWVNARGVCWGTEPNPTISLSTKTSNATGNGTFTSTITGLVNGTVYHVRAYAKNSAGTAYGEDLTFTASGISNPTITTASISSITATTAVSGGTISNNGGDWVNARGVCWGTEPNPTISLSTKTSNATGNGTFTSTITGLVNGTVYHVRAYAKNSAGTAYGEDLTFTASGISNPTITTASISSITATTAVSGGSISYNGSDLISARGVCWDTEPNPTISLSTKTTDGTGNGAYASNITGLSNGVTYHVRAYATNTAGTFYGEDLTFTASSETSIPTITTNSISNITETSATGGGIITSEGGLTVTARGICWSTSINPTTADSKTTDGAGSGSFTSSITGLTKDVVYHVRAYATNSKGTAYGSDLFFTAKIGGSSAADNDNMMLGNPSSATTEIVNANNYLMIKPQYDLSYNNSKLTTNWTSWHVYSSDLGTTARQDDFRADTDLPVSWYRVNEGDYDYSTYGFDRGHMCPSADRTSSIPNNSATFLMTNMIPQAPNNNQGPWMKLEDYARSLVNSSNELYIICGPYGQGGKSAKGTFSTLASGVNVPSYTWKIIVVIPNGNDDLNRISSTTRVIAVWMPNNNDTCPISSLWTSYRVSVDYIESQTGYDFLSNVSTTIQNVIEANVDNL